MVTKILLLLLIVPVITSREQFSSCNLTASLLDQQFIEHYQTTAIQDGEIDCRLHSLSSWSLCFSIEFIVQFTGYYSSLTRANYLHRVFQRANVSDFEIVKRNNAMQRYPSDFDIVRVGVNRCVESLTVTCLCEHQVHGSEQLIKALRDHPLIRAVNPHRQIIRHIHYSTSTC